MLTSKEILERTGISRATLNNYIGSGLVPKPEILAPGPEDGAAPRIGYFPDDTVDRIETIQRLKREGWSIGRIAAFFAGADQGPAAGDAAAPAAAGVQMPGPTTAAAGEVLPGPGVPGARRSGPAVMSVAVLVATLQDAGGLWVRLSAQEYFELVNEVWAELDGIFRRHGGLAGRHPDEGLVAYFLPRRDGSYLWNALAAATAARDAMRRLSGLWQVRKGWDMALCMNTGIDEGQEWMGAIGAADLRVLGEAADRAEQLSRCGRMGAILATRSLLGKLSPDERRRVSFGVPRPHSADAEARLLLTFARLADIASPATVPAHVADLGVAEILDLQIAAGGPA